MKKILLPAMLMVAAVAIPSTRPLFKGKPFHTVSGRVTGDPVITRDGQRVYFVRDSTEIWLYDRGTKAESRVLSMATGNVAVSPAGDRMLFNRVDEGGKDAHLWSVTLDRRTGLTAGQPRRVSLTIARYGEFSPDGNTIAFESPATDSEDNLIVVPSAGGPERIIARTTGDVWPIRWTPDGRTLYYGLSHNSETATRKNGIFRIPVSGGASAMVAHTADWGTYPGLSPDGRHLMFWDPATWDSVVVATADGKRVLAHKAVEGDDLPEAWLDGNRAFGWKKITPRFVSVMPIGGSPRRLTDTTQQHLEPRWSPDGKRLVMVQLEPSALVIVNPDGTNRRTVRLPVAVAPNNSISWSPDGKHILYRANGWPPSLHIVDASTGAITEVASRRPQYVWESWRADSRAVLYATGDTLYPTDSIRTLDIRERVIGGADRSLGRVRMYCSFRNFCDGKIINDTLVATWTAGRYTIENLRAPSRSRTIVERGNIAAQPVATFTPDGRWMAVRRAGADGQLRAIEVIGTDGSGSKTVNLPFATAPGPYNPRILPGGRELIVAAGDVALGGAGFFDARFPVTYHRVDVATGKTTKLAELAHQDRAPSGIPGISPDLKTIAFGTAPRPSMTFYELDVSALIRAAATPR